MKLSKDIKQASKIALMFVIVTSIFSLLDRLQDLVPIGDESIGFKNFFKLNIGWLAVIILMIIGLCILIHKQDGKINMTLINEPAIRVVAGILISLDGLIKLSDKISVFLINTNMLNRVTSIAGEKIAGDILVSDLIPIIAYVLQIATGLYFAFSLRKQAFGGENKLE